MVLESLASYGSTSSSRSRIAVQFLYLNNQIIHPRTIRAVLPIPVVNAVHLVVQPHRAARSDAHVDTPLHAIPQQPHAHPIGAACALIQLLEVDGVLQRTALDQGFIGDLLVVVGETHDEAEIDARLRVEVGGAQLEDVAHALRGAVHAVDAVVLGRAPEVGECEVDLGAHALHGRENEFAEAGLVEVLVCA